MCVCVCVCVCVCASKEFNSVCSEVKAKVCSLGGLGGRGGNTKQNAEKAYLHLHKSYLYVMLIHPPGTRQNKLNI